ncbi:hypothetical protein SAMN04489835_2546 [Mycolicibacterium rutilum]|uniref:Uncharacterized protein n=1 Tax=Mycolicibacterium rutilum TaxID=370526 RepID=A0A1H6JT92_MYCRU|nr:hypothetical protein SAMN04489835_2546 [Mycolicibacterium rutilum]
MDNSGQLDAAAGAADVEVLELELDSLDELDFSDDDDDDDELDSELLLLPFEELLPASRLSVR